MTNSKDVVFDVPGVTEVCFFATRQPTTTLRSAPLRSALLCSAPLSDQ